MYDESSIAHMREELACLGVSETKTAEDVATILAEPGTALAIINSVCGCAAANARPSVKAALQNAVLPDRSFTVFAGNDIEATARLRSAMAGCEPSSHNIILFKNGEMVFNLERHQIQGRPAARDHRR